MSKLLTPDICVIGGGSGGLSVAAAAAAFGVPVVLIEGGKMGGDCLNYGCVPSKAMLAAGKQAHSMRHGEKFGIANVEPEVNFRKVHDHVESVIEAIRPNDSVERFTAMGVHVIEAYGRFTGPGTVVAGDYEIKARRFVIATGSSPFVPPIEGIDSVDYLTNETIFEQTRKPKHLIVVGGGPIGMEMAQAHQRLGAQVTVIEAFNAMGKDDPELAAIVLQKLRGEGINILEQSKVTKIERKGKAGVRVHYEADGEARTVDGSDLLMAVGRAANVKNLGLEEAKIGFDRSGIKVDKGLRTSNRKVYAIGDVAGGLQFTHVAGYHAGLIIRAILFRLPITNSTSAIPWVTYTDPELANVGMTEEEARKAHGDDINILRWPYAENDRAQAERKTDGLIKMVTNRKGKILGVAIVGANAGEMISLWTLAISKKMKVRDVTGFVPPYPTLSEIGKRAAVTYFVPQTSKPLVRKVIGFLRKFG